MEGGETESGLGEAGHRKWRLERRTDFFMEISIHLNHDLQLFCLFFLPAFCLASAPQAPALHDLHVEIKPGEQSGDAVVTVNGKSRRIVKHATRAWPVMKGENALIIVEGQKPEENGKYRLLFVDGDTRRRRDLGAIPFSSGELKDVQLPDGDWAFVVTGQSAASPMLIVADNKAVHGRVPGASAARIIGPLTVRYTDTRTGHTVSVPLTSLLGADFDGIYQVHAIAVNETDYVQFQPDGSSAFSTHDGHTLKGRWWTDGNAMTTVLSNGQRLEWLRASLTKVKGVPAGMRLVVRLLQPLESQKAKDGDPVKAVLLSPATVEGKIYLPQGSEFDGKIVAVHGVGWAFEHETAALTLKFDIVTLPDGSTLPIHTRLYQVENAQEKVNDKGTIEGIRSTGTTGHSAESKIASVAAVDPIAYLFSTVSSTAALGFAEPEILYDAGTELEIEVTAPLITSKVFQPSVPPIATSPGDLKKLEDMVRALPFRTATQAKNKPSDITNLAFIGSTDAVKRAFQAAEWVFTDQLTASSTFRTLKTISGNEAYKEAPMSVLLLDERLPIFTLTKTTNTFNSRHHLRVFDPALEYQGEKILTSSSTQDIGIAFSPKQKTFIHVIDQYIDNERSQVVDDLIFTGCVAAVQLVPRPWVPKDTYNSTGDRLRTDGAIAVMKMTDCLHPKTTPNDNAVPPSRLERITRDTVLTLRNDLWRGNLGYQGYAGAKWLHKYWRTKDELKPERGTWRKANIAGVDYEGLGDISPEEQPTARISSGNGEETTPGPAEEAAERSHRWDPPRYEIGLQGGYLRYPTIRTEGIGIFASPKDPNSGDPSFLIGLFDEVDGGWTAGIVFTANTWRWISNEFSYNYERGKYQMGVLVLATGEIDPIEETQSVGLATRQFEYNILFNARPRESRWRPYAAIGPALQLISLTDAPIKKASGPFKVGLQNIGILKAAFDFGSTPPLEGGGIYQIGLQYGCGIKFRVLPRLTVRADFRETWSKNPQFILDSYTKDFFFTENYQAEYQFIRAESKFRQQRFTLGFAFTF
jgi:hypothetical protein